MFMNRGLQLFKRRQKAASLGFKFDRAANFTLPARIIINGNICKLHLPEEHGIKIAVIELLLDDCYGCFNIVKNNSPINTVLDIGANVGLFGVMARNAFPNAVIQAYEPNPHLEKYLKVQAAIGKYAYFMEAVGMENDKVDLDFKGESVLTQTRSSDSGAVTQVAFRDAIARIGGNVDFLKMDCEGAEWELFRDTDSWQRVRYLSMEYHLFGQHTLEELLAKVQDLGFRMLDHRCFGNFGLLRAERKLSHI